MNGQQLDGGKGKLIEHRTEPPEPPSSPWELEHSDTFHGRVRGKFGIVSHPFVNLFASPTLCQGMNGLSGSHDSVIEAVHVNLPHEYNHVNEAEGHCRAWLKVFDT